MKKKAKIIIGVVVAIGIASAMAWSSMQPLGVAAVTLAPKEAYAYFTEDGTVLEGTDFALYPEVSGTILRVSGKKGDYVNTGDILAEIDKSNYESQIAMHEANIKGYNAQIASALENEQNAKDDYSAAIATLRTQLSEIEAQRKSAEAARLAAPSVSEQLNLLQISIDQARTDTELLESNLEKVRRLYDSGAASKAQLDEAQSAFDTSYAALKQLETEYAQISGKSDASELAEKGEAELFASQRRAVNEQISELTKNIEKDYSGATKQYYEALILAESEAIASLREKLDKCALRAPVSGYITDFPIESLSAASPQAVAAIIKTDGDIVIESYVATKDLSAIKEGDEVALVLKGRDADQMFSGKIEEISKWAEAKTTALGLNEKKVRVIISVADELIPGSDLEVRFTVLREQGKLLVPTSAIFTADGNDYVFVIEGGKAVKAQITKGVKTLTETVVESGLKSGDTVITEANSDTLKEGARVKAN